LKAAKGLSACGDMGRFTGWESIPKNGTVADPGLISIAPGDDNAPCLGLPVRIGDSITIGFVRRARYTSSSPPETTHEGDRSWRRIELRQLVFLNTTCK
jgi:hypothetical protein